MFDEEKTLENINNYLKKMTMVINSNASFSIFGFKFIKRNRVDDVLCCIEATLPKEYKDAIRKHGAQKFRGYSCYLELLDSFKKYKSFSPDHYIVKHNIVLRQITVLKSSIQSDFRKVAQENINKL